MNTCIIRNIIITALAFCFLSGKNMLAQIPDPDLGLRAEWMRGTYGFNWKPVRSQNGGSESEHYNIDHFLEQIKNLKTVDYIQVHLNESSIYSPVHVGPHSLIESFWEGDTDANGNIINLAVPRQSIGRDPFMDMIKAVKRAGLKVMVYANSSNMLRRSGTDSPVVIPDVTDRWMEWCDTASIAQAFITSKSYHTDGVNINRPYMFCYAEFILKEYAIRYGDLIDAWCFDSGRYMWEFGGDNKDSDDVEEQRVYQAFADACHAGNPDASLAFQNSPGSSDMVNNPFSAATLFDDYMFGHPFSGGNNVGDVEQNYFILEWTAARDGYAHINDGRTRTWDDMVVGHYDPPMSDNAWNSGKTPGVETDIFVEYYATMLHGNGAVSFGIPLVGKTNYALHLLCEDWGMEQLGLLEDYLTVNQHPGAPNWARQYTVLTDAILGEEYSHTLIEGVDFWDPEGDEITDLHALTEDNPPSWLTISETEPGTWTLSGTPTDTESTEYEFSLRLENSSGESDRRVQLKIIDPGSSIPVTGLSISPGSTSLFVDESKLLSALVYPSDATNKSLSWSSNNTAIATVNSIGLITAHAIGNVTIKATTHDGDFIDECDVTVMEFIPVTGVVVAPDSVSLTTFGETVSLNATVQPADATNQNISWSSNDPTVATVNSSGEVLANGSGSATIMATSDDGAYTDICIVTVSSEVAANLALGGIATQSSTNFSAGADLAIDGNTDGLFNNGSVTHTDKDGSPWWEVDLGEEYGIDAIIIFGRMDDCCKDRLSDFTVFVYNSSGTEVHSETFTSYPDPSVSSNVGGIEGQKVRIELNNSTYALSLAEVQVFGSILVDSVVVSPDSLSFDAIGESQALSATVYPLNATNQGVTWMSNDTSIATVDSTGFVLAQDTGVALITATSLDGGFTDDCIVSLILEDTTSTETFIIEKPAKDLMLYPNPANKTLNYDLRNIEGVSRIAIYSLLGKQLNIQNIDSPSGYIDISDLQSGIYILKLIGNETMVTRFVKK